jgi:hypothetical protein
MITSPRIDPDFEAGWNAKTSAIVTAPAATARMTKVLFIVHPYYYVIDLHYKNM